MYIFAAIEIWLKCPAWSQLHVFLDCALSPTCLGSRGSWIQSENHTHSRSVYHHPPSQTCSDRWCSPCGNRPTTKRPPQTTPPWARFQAQGDAKEASWQVVPVACGPPVSAPGKPSQNEGLPCTKPRVRFGLHYCGFLQSTPLCPEGPPRRRSQVRFVRDGVS